MSATSPTARTLALLRAQGFTAQVVERWNPHSRTRQDLYGTGDVLAFDQNGTLLVQACAGASTAARCKKAAANPNLAAWLSERLARQFVVIAWRKIGPRGKRKTWQPRILTPVCYGDTWEWGENWCPVPKENP